MKVLVTGGAGFIGSHVVSALAAGGHTVRVLDNFTTGRRPNLEGQPVEVVEGDVRDEAALRPAMTGVTHVVHLAALVSVPQSLADPLECHAVNVTGSLNVFLAARASGARRVVMASSSAVYGETAAGALAEEVPLHPISPYGASKLAAEQYGAAFSAIYDLEVVALRYFNVFGPRQDPQSPYAAVIPKFISAMLAGRRPTIYGDGGQTRDFTYVADVVRGTLLALEAEDIAGRSLNLATGQGASLNQLAGLLGELAQAAGVASAQAGPEYAAPRPGDIRHSTADISRARALLRYEPRVSLREGLAQTLAGFRQRTAPTRPLPSP